MLGSSTNVPKKWYVLAQFWPTNVRDDLKTIPDKLKKITIWIGDKFSNIMISNTEIFKKNHLKTTI